MSSNIKCAYCGQMTKAKNCCYYRGVTVHNKSSCNCFQAAVNNNFFVEPVKTKNRY